VPKSQTQLVSFTSGVSYVRVDLAGVGTVRLVLLTSYPLLYLNSGPDAYCEDTEVRSKERCTRTVLKACNGSHRNMV
jgi:hypothetical protein